MTCVDHARDAATHHGRDRDAAEASAAVLVAVAAPARGADVDAHPLERGRAGLRAGALAGAREARVDPECVLGGAAVVVRTGAHRLGARLATEGAGALLVVLAAGRGRN